MLISIDESGTFANTTDVGSWSVVAAFTFPERSKSKIYKILDATKRSVGFSSRQEIKLKHLNEAQYFEFLVSLQKVESALFAVATDISHTNVGSVVEHKHMQAEKIRINIPRMIHESGKQGIKKLADDIESLSPQLYVQLQCQSTLIHNVLNSAILFYVVRDPKTLRRFSWKIDQKNTNKGLFESAFEIVIPPFLQASSFKDPLIRLIEGDYSYMKAFEFTTEQYPKYLQAIGKVPEPTLNVGKIIRDDFSFPDSKNEKSVQVVDLLVSGVRRCLRGGFEDNQTAATLLGSLMVKAQNPKTCLSLVNVAVESDSEPDITATNAVKLMDTNAQPMIK